MRREAVASELAPRLWRSPHGLHVGGVETRSAALISGTVDLGDFHRPGELLVLKFDIRFDRLVRWRFTTFTTSVPLSDRGRGIEIRHLDRSVRLRILRRVHKQLQRLTLGVIGEQLQRIVDGLQEQSLLVG